jgi:CheY-like chemotaxis protein
MVLSSVRELRTGQTAKELKAAQMKRVLIVDDDPIVLRIYRDGLSMLGLHVDTAEDGLAALKALQQAKPDIMVLDLVMPKLSGVDVLKFVRANPKLTDLPVIVFSNSHAQEVAREAAGVGAQKGLLKTGCDPLLLAGVIGELLDGQSATGAEAHLLGVVVPASLPQAQVLPPAPVVSPPARPLQAPPIAPTPVAAHACQQFADSELKARARMEFLAKAKNDCLSSRNLVGAFQAATTERERRA